MIDIFSEQLVELGEARAYPVFCRGNRRASIQKMYRLALHGARAANGARVRLEVVRTPGGIRTSREAIQRFIERLTNPDLPPPDPPAVRQCQSQRAVEELQAAGFEVGGQ
ncbi:hypothetical protein [Fontivita pretiosa]|uniref:hypothetical protein n=1 Tax=Fontivita pretiosa TaxID=2989684 RepID=UPI003D163FFD